MWIRTIAPALAVVFVVACGDDGEKAGDASTGGGGDGATGDGSMPSDGATGDGGNMTPDGSTTPAIGPACGATTCTNGTQDCCIGQNTVCKPAGTCPSQSFSCDGPEDCAGGACCFGNGGQGGSECSTSTSCSAACHDDGDCPASASKCCPKAFTPNYKVCQQAC